MNPDTKFLGNLPGLLWSAALLYTTFVVYGSLVPLEFHALPWGEAVARFSAIPFLTLGFDSRTDWASNFLLFVPLTFLWMSVLTAGTSRLRSILIALILIPIAAVLSAGIEFTQLFFQQRTPSQNDIFAETLGGIVGVMVWWVAGSRFAVWLQAWHYTHSRAMLAERLAWVYLAGVLAYNVLPLDLTISLVEVFHKFQDGRINLIPFTRLPDDAAYALYELATDALIWLMLALLWRLDGTRNFWLAWGLALAMAGLLEIVQLWVYSRVSDVTDLFTAAIGAVLGSFIGGWLAAREAPIAPSPSRAWLPLVLVLGWIATLLLVFWFPFDFHTDGIFIKSRIEFVYRVPFEMYYTGTEYRAITEVLHKTLFFAPLGGGLAWGVACLPWRWRAPLFWLAMLVLIGMPAVIELGQVMLPQKVADTTDWLLAWLGGLAGYRLARYALRAPRRAVPQHAFSRIVKPAEAKHLRWHLPLSITLMTCLFWGVAYAPFVPYNVRELLRPGAALLSGSLLALAVVWLAVWPVWLARRNVSASARLLQLPLGLLVYGVVTFVLLWAAVPEESLHDLVGSPVLFWPGQWETGLRWIALTAIPGTLLYLATQCLRRWRGRRLGALHFWAALPVLLLAYWGIVSKAATDNLTELIATPQPLAFTALCAWLCVLFLAAAALASPLPTSKCRARRLGLFASLPLAILLLHLGLADDINKYGQQFSAMQFLLSADRQHYATQPVLWLRYSVLHVLVIAALAFIQWPHFRSVSLSDHLPAHASH